LASCAFGVTTPATNVTDSSALLTGVVRNTITGPTDFWFDYGHTSAYGSSTPHGSVDVTDTANSYPVTAPLAGLHPGAEYHSRLCALDANGKGVCGGDQAFATVGDSVTGRGTVFSIPDLGFVIGAAFDASSGSDGSAPSGTAEWSPGSFFFRFRDVGPVTCLRIDGHRATVGFVAQPVIDPDLKPIPELLFVEDNGATGDRLGMRVIAAPATTCPVATGADFPDFVLGGVVIPPVLTTGDFVIRDAAS
jgi:hypothetical protein